MSSSGNPLVVLYLFLDGDGEVSPPHPSVRTSSCRRYLECALAQAATLCLRETACDIALVTNVESHGSTRKDRQLLAAIKAFGVELLAAQPAADPHLGFLGDALTRACDGQPEDRPLWLMNMDCVWVRPERVFAALPDSPGIASLHIPYPADWHVAGVEGFASCRNAIGEIAAALGGPARQAPAWIGADLLGGTRSDLVELSNICLRMRERLAGEGRHVQAEQLLSLAGASGQVSLHDLSSVAARLHTGRRHRSPRTPGATALGLWHLPAEKGLSFRRTANSIARGRTNRLRADLEEPKRLATRFNVRPTPLARQLRDDAWLAAAQVARALAAVRAVR